MSDPQTWNWRAVRGAVIQRGSLEVLHVHPTRRAAVAALAGKHDMRVRVVDRHTVRLELKTVGAGMVLR